MGKDIGRISILTLHVELQGALCTLSCPSVYKWQDLQSHAVVTCGFEGGIKGWKQSYKENVPSCIRNVFKMPILNHS